jgi:hypothetical protein
MKINSVYYYPKLNQIIQVEIVQKKKCTNIYYHTSENNIAKFNSNEKSGLNKILKYFIFLGEL